MQNEFQPMYSPSIQQTQRFSFSDHFQFSNDFSHSYHTGVVPGRPFMRGPHQEHTLQLLEQCVTPSTSATCSASSAAAHMLNRASSGPDLQMSPRTASAMSPTSDRPHFQEVYYSNDYPVHSNHDHQLHSNYAVQYSEQYGVEHDNITTSQSPDRQRVNSQPPSHPYSFPNIEQGQAQYSDLPYDITTVAPLQQPYQDPRHSPVSQPGGEPFHKLDELVVMALPSMRAARLSEGC